jgi:hypothetical protein
VSATRTVAVGSNDEYHWAVADRAQRRHAIRAVQITLTALAFFAILLLHWRGGGRHNLDLLAFGAAGGVLR